LTCRVAFIFLLRMKCHSKPVYRVTKMRFADVAAGEVFRLDPGLGIPLWAGTKEEVRKGELPNLLPYIRVSSNDSVTVGVCGGCSQEPRLGVLTHTQLPEQGIKYRSTRTPLEFTSFDERPCFQARLKLKRLEVADEHERSAYAAAWAGAVPDRSFKLFPPPAGALPVHDLFSLVGFPSLSGQLALERRRLDAVFSCLLGQQQGLLDVSALVTTQQPGRRSEWRSRRRS
jgi:hypothetical protein